MREDYRSQRSGHFETPLFCPEQWLDSLTTVAVWRLLILGLICIASLNWLFQANGIHNVGPLYMVPICIACWRFGFKTGMGIAVAEIILSLVGSLRVSGHLDASAMIELVMQLIKYGCAAGVVARFRQSFDRERLLARRDWMTGILNRQEFQRQAEVMLVSAAARNQSLLLAYFDLDGFKAVNDQFGHQAGDRLLQSLAEEGKSLIGLEDCFGRMGGDEFAVLMELSKTERALAVTEHLHAGFTAALERTGHMVTCSMGAVVALPGGSASLHELMRHADQLMYAVKHDTKAGFSLAGHTPPFDFESSMPPRPQTYSHQS
ncbi:GGDEF domain-containing protein [Rhizobium leucaenae]|uniref:diguanylate cyclase n=1 Tax=Rhizobium leucaenae TaxID=29450 RepID=A0A7W7EPB4_9HYPH|nr:GGDEF domain-containing protein [Rhizobium leucaenae]MBB4571068.1 diguanylate cyclase (GGDEF)-like protein [Rhizobium leucaenae]MBB6304162.1 diguanylate cyclase (GGDEF)-like protein [Rhizobium leucaenae]